MEGFGLSGKNIGTKVSVLCDSDVVPPADAEVESVVNAGKLEVV